MQTFVEIRKNISGETVGVRMFNDDGVNVRNDIYFEANELWQARLRFKDEKSMGFQITVYDQAAI